MPEHDNQRAIMDWAKIMAKQLPDIELLFSIPNQNILLSRLPPRARFQVISYMESEGMRKGVPDLCLPVARGGYHGLYLENKYKRNKPSPEQAWWMDRLTQAGHLATAAWSVEEAIEILTEYLRL
jgi:hypothetical protein